MCRRSTAGRSVSRRTLIASTSGLPSGSPCSAAQRTSMPGALLEHQLGVDVGLDLDGGVVHPGAPRVGPALDAVGPPAGPVGGDGRAPPAEAGVVDVHREVVVDAVRVGEHRGGVDGVVALAEDLGGDDELLVLDRLRRPGATVDQRLHVLHRDPSERQHAVRQRLGEQPERDGGGLRARGRPDTLGAGLLGVGRVGVGRVGAGVEAVGVGVGCGRGCSGVGCSHTGDATRWPVSSAPSAGGVSPCVQATETAARTGQGTR